MENCEYPPPTLMDQFSPERIMRILPTSTTPRPDVFKTLKPTKAQNLDYTISQTCATLQQGDTIINVKETTALYTPKPPKKERKRGKLFSGGPPKWKFVEEIRAEKVERLQAQCRKEHQERLVGKRKHDSGKTKSQHQKLQDLVGPEWFQELSPKQLVTVDMLRFAIQIDMVKGTTINTEEDLASLGLVLRPNKHHVKFALRNCCGDPVEFLLVLYQIINPNRTCYSLNDRLLLSAVVHLTITETLHELHVRIPSPPRVRKPSENPPIKPKKIKYESPYLEPLTYYPVPRRFHGIYYNKHRQYPVSPYFSYLFCLREEQLLNITNGEVMEHDEKVDGDFKKEWKQAQTFYENLPGGLEMPKLLMPKLHPICPDNTLQSKSFVSNVIKVPVPTLVKLSSPDFDKCDCTDRKTITDYETIVRGLDEEDTVDRRCECKNQAKQFLEKVCNCEGCQAEKWKRSIIPIFGGFSAAGNGGGIPIITGIISTPLCNCLEIYINKLKAIQEAKYLSEMETKFVMNGVTITKDGPCYALSSVVAPEVKEEKIETQEEEEISESTTTFSEETLKSRCQGCKEKAHEILKKVDKSQNICSCVEKYKDQVEKYEYGQSVKEGKHIIKSQREAKYIVAGVVKTPEGPVYSITGQKTRHRKKRTKSAGESTDKEPDEEHADENKKCFCKPPEEEIESTNDDIDSEEDWCRCGEAMEMMLQNQCKCDKCNMLRRQYNSTYVISGTRLTESGTAINVMGGVRSNECSCLHDYYEKLRKVFEYRRRCRLRLKLKQQQNTYVVSGVHATPNGPVYNLCCVKPPPECECGKILREMKEEEERARQMAKMPETGRVKYVVSGVRAMQGENVYILSRALATDECPCMEILKEFEGTHKDCLEVYEEFMQKVDEEIAAYMEDIAQDKRWATVDADKAVKDDDDCCCKGLGEDLLCREYSEEEGEADDDLEKYLRQLQIYGEDEFQVEDGGGDQSPNKCNCCMCCVMGSDTSLIPEINPITLPPREPKPREESLVSKSTKSSLITEYKSKRFFISVEFPKTKDKQIEILEKILEGMANDNFPLAKLPHCYKLPHFKLWWHSRVNTSWTYKDKVDSVGWSKNGWKHSDLCYKQPSVPHLNLDKCKAREFTWRDAKLIKTLCARKEEMFYRKLKQEIIESVREFYASTYSYEFPTKTFRDCFFAYQPAKEEEVFPFKVVRAHERPEIPSYRKFPCYC